MSTRRILVVTPFPPSRDVAHGGGRVTAELLLRLARRHDVGLLTLRTTADLVTEDAVRTALAFVEEIPTTAIGRSPRRLVREWRRARSIARRDPDWVVGSTVAALRRRLPEVVEEWRPEIVQLELAPMAPYAAAVRGHGPPVVLVDHDALANGRDAPDASWRRVLERSAGDISRVVVLSDEDRARLAPFVGDARLRVIRPGIDLPATWHPAGEPDEVLFVGSFVHPPNAEAADRLVRSIFPRVRALSPRANLTIVGSGTPPESVRDGAGVTVAGRVPDVAPYVDRAAVVVAPISLGGGVRVKVMEALAAGKALVATPRAIEGLDVRDGEQVLIRDTDASFAAAVGDLLLQAASRERLGRAARLWSEAHLSWDHAADRYDALYQELASPTGSVGPT